MNPDLNDTWYVEPDDTTVNPLGNGAFRIVPYSAYARRKEQKCSARPQYVATVYDEEIAREMVKLHNAKRRQLALLAQGGFYAPYIPMQVSCAGEEAPNEAQDTAKEDKMSQIVERECFGARIYSDLENLITAARLAEQTRICKMLGGSVDNWEIAEENLKRTLLSFPETLKRN